MIQYENITYLIYLLPIALSARSCKSITFTLSNNKLKMEEYSESESEYGYSDDESDVSIDFTLDLNEFGESTASGTPKQPNEDLLDEASEPMQWDEPEQETQRICSQQSGIWTFLEHKGPWFAPPYETLPRTVGLYYENERVHLSKAAEEIAVMYARIKHRKCTTKKIFNDNFFEDWRKSMTPEERAKIKDLSKCNFNEIAEHLKMKKESEKNQPNESEKFGICTIQYANHNEKIKQKIDGFKIQPGLFEGKGEHPEMGRVKRRIWPESVTINCSQDSQIPKPHRGGEWHKIISNNKVAWVASWPGSNGTYYAKLHRSTKWKMELDERKFDFARKLDKHIDQIRRKYINDLSAGDLVTRQLATALYFIDHHSFRIGGSKDTKRVADTVGCCTLRVEHVKLPQEYDDSFVEFDFLGKASIRYYRRIIVRESVLKNLREFKRDKSDSQRLFDKLDDNKLNKYLDEMNVMKGLTGKVFRTYNASKKMQQYLERHTDENASEEDKIKVYRMANYEVAKLCNHKHGANDKSILETSKANYIDPRITIAWCLKHNVDIKKIYSKSLREIFAWAIKMMKDNRAAAKEFVF